VSPKRQGRFESQGVGADGGAAGGMEADGMAGEVERRLAGLGLDLPEAAAPLAAYVPCVVTGNLAFVSGQLPFEAGEPVTGRLSAADHVAEPPVEGEGRALARAKAAARLCALNMLAHLKVATGDLDRVARVIKLTGFVNADDTFRQHPKVIDGASELMAAAFGDAGRHARAAVGSSGLPLGAIVEVEGVFEIG